VRGAGCSCADEYAMSSTGICEKCPENTVYSWLQLAAIIASVLVSCALCLLFFIRQTRYVHRHHTGRS
jgi:hypothetical protein